VNLTLVLKLIFLLKDSTDEQSIARKCPENVFLRLEITYYSQIVKIFAVPK
jgi:hypothetical protein